MVGIIRVRPFWLVLLGVTNDMIVHAEPSPDKETYANDVAEWIFARCGGLVTEPVRSKL
jgi:hypothetical protein